MFTPDANDEGHEDLDDNQIKRFVEETGSFLAERACCNVSASIIAFTVFNGHVQAMLADGIHPNVRMSIIRALLEVVQSLGGEVQFLKVERPDHESN